MYRTIVVGTDCSPTAEAAVAKAAELAKSMGAVLYVVSAFHEPVSAMVAASASAVPAADWTAAIDDRVGRVIATGERLRNEGLRVVARVEHGEAAATLVTIAAEVDADLIVVGDRGLKGLRGLLGSVPNTVAHRAKTDVLVIHTS